MTLPPPPPVFQSKFDYIITHGVYSWVSDDVKDAIMFCSAQLLKSNGLAYISYNTYPGWKHQDIVRDLMFYAAKKVNDNDKKLAVAKATLNAYINSMENSNDDYRQKSFHSLLNDAAKSVLNNSNESYIFHEYLEEYNTPLYFSDFVQTANNHGLSYLIDALMVPTYVTFTENLEPLDRIEREQYGDFLCNRNFRASILTHTNNIEGISNALNHTTFSYSDLDKLEFFGNFIFKEECVESASGNSRHSKSFETLARELNDHYPASINTKYLINKYPDKKDEIYRQLTRLITYSTIGFVTRKLESLDYAVGKVRVKPSYIKYFELFANTDNPYITASDMLGRSVKINSAQAKFITMFDGVNSREEIIQAAQDFMHTTQQHFIVTLNDGTSYAVQDPDEIQKACSEFIDEIINILKYHYFFEKI